MLWQSAWNMFTDSTTALLRNSGTFLLVCGLLGWYLYQRVYVQRALQLSPAQQALLHLFLGFCLLFIVHTMFRFTARSWYFVSSVFFFTLVLGYAGQSLSRLSVKYVAVGVCVLVLSLSFFYVWQDDLHNQYVHQRGMYRMALYMNAHLPPDTRVGVFNAGVQGYFSHVHVVNLDGLVNNSAYEALRQRRLWSYIKEEHITYLSDFDLYILGFFTPFLDTPRVRTHLEDVHRQQILSPSRPLPDIALYKVLETEE
jgi:hypothetical protein